MINWSMLSWMRFLPLPIVSLLSVAGFVLVAMVSWLWLWLAIPMMVLTSLGFFDLFHPTNNLLRIYPLLAYGRFAAACNVFSRKSSATGSLRWPNVGCSCS